MKLAGIVPALLAIAAFIELLSKDAGHMDRWALLLSAGALSFVINEAAWRISRREKP
jgi:hypothetical protein